MGKSRYSSSDDDDSPRKRRRVDDKDDSKKRRLLEKLRKLKEKKSKKSKKKKEEKKQRRKERREKKVAAYFGYTEDSNPFGDENLFETFVWKKKEDQEKKSGKKKKVDDEKRREELLDEIEKVKRRRQEREAEKEEMERLRAEEQRLKEMAMYGDWEKKEEEFHLKQARVRSTIRIKEGREKPVDILAKNILLYKAAEEGEDDIYMDVELREPYEVFEGLHSVDLEELQKDIKTYLEMEENPEFQAYWKALSIVCEDELERTKAREAGERGSRLGVHSALEGTLHSMFHGKTHKELQTMEGDILSKLDAMSANEDRSFWEGALKALYVAKAKAQLTEYHASILVKRLNQLEEKKRELAKTKGSSKSEPKQKQEEEWESDSDVDREAAAQADDGSFSPALEPYGEEGSYSPPLEPYDEQGETKADGSYSPPLVPFEEATEEEKSNAVDPEQDRRQIKAQRAQALRILRTGGDPTTVIGYKAQLDLAPETDTSAAASEMYKSEAKKGLDAMEEVFSEAVPVAAETYSWQDKYRPRKPRYFNRVKTGYDWNKYNQTHYDHDNPPPKTVQGYKFNVFYPDLIDKSEPPRYILEPADTDDFCIIRFHAGPPYEDIAFKIVNKEWETGHRRGFRCVFERGILQLYFNFKRHRYRR